MKRNNRLRFVVVFCLLIALVWGFSISITSSVNTYDFENFSEEDSIAFVEACNIAIPAKLQQSEYLSVFTHSLILQTYNNPNVRFYFNYEETQQYAEDVRLAVLSYLENVPAVASETTYSLLYSRVKNANGSWVTNGGHFNPKWSNFNCYAYSINRAEQPQFYASYPYIQYQPGNMSDKARDVFLSCETIDELAQIVRDDLIQMGYSNVSLSTSIPTIDSSKELICVRMLYDFDYHFMRYDLNTNAWYHKPGDTAVLKYNLVPSNNSLWYNECSDEEGEHPATFVYNSDIVFITYSKNQISVPQTSTSREYIRPGKDVFCELNVDESGYYEVQLSSTYQFKYEIYDEDFDIVISGTGTRYNTILSLVAGKYYLRANFTTNTTLFPVSVLITEHGHSYQYSIINTPGSGVGGNLYYHQTTCTECSYTAQESHAWQANTTQSGTTYTCTKCTLVTTTPPAIQDGSGEDGEVMALIDNADTAESPCDCLHSHETNSPDGD